MEVVCVQHDIVWEDKAANCARARAMIDEARPKPGALVVLPEMFASGFSMNVDATADDDGAVRRFLADTARELGIWLMGGVVICRADGRAQNCAVTYSPAGELVADYAKIYPFRLGGETSHYAAGDRVEHFEWAGARVAPFVCYDLRFPEVFRQATAQGAEVITVIASWPLPRDQHWLTLLRARAIENLAYVVGVNRSGTDPKYTYFGRSMIVDPKGEVIADAGPEAGVIRAEINLELVRGWRRDFPALLDIRADFR